MSTLFLALEFPHDEDFQAATIAAYEPDSPFLKHLELVVQSHYAPSMVNPVREGAILFLADAQTALYALQTLAGIAATSPSALEDPPAMDEILRATGVLMAALEAIQS